ncbi:uncharacterized protein J3R85_012986 [Psidium guajava]|nr:uncharacterized protein J3R85_012986 [Psidium guajava]
MASLLGDSGQLLRYAEPPSSSVATPRPPPSLPSLSLSRSWRRHGGPESPLGKEFALPPKTSQPPSPSFTVAGNVAPHGKHLANRLSVLAAMNSSNYYRTLRKCWQLKMSDPFCSS